jgi:hypothetical protein
VTPFVGGDLAAVRTIADSLDDLSHQAFPTMVDLAGSFDLTKLVPKGGGLDLAELVPLAGRLGPVMAVVQRCAAQLGALDPGRLNPEVGAAVTQLRDGLARVASLTRTAYLAATLMPPMLGLNGPRTYLVLLQNLAESRATGGMPGAFIVVRADHGQLTLVDQGTAAATLGMFPQPVLALTTNQQALYTDKLGVYPADVNLTPDFPTAAALAREMYRRRSGTTVDGVVAADPVVLSYLLKATGPVTVPGGPTLNATSAVRTLLSDAYRTMTGAEQDHYFAAAARATFTRLAVGALDPKVALAALARAAGERRLLVWSSHPDEQTALAGTALGGTLPLNDGNRAVMGVYLDDGTGAKLDYYLTHSAQISVTGCWPDGRVALQLRITLGSTAPSSGLPPDVLGLALAGKPYVMRTNVLVFSTVKGALVDMNLDGHPVPFGQGIERRRLVGILSVDLQPGQTRTLIVNALTQPYSSDNSEPSSVGLSVTPGVNLWQLGADADMKCAVVG